MFVSINELLALTGLSFDEDWIEKNLTQLGLEVESVTSISCPESICAAHVLSKKEIDKESSSYQVKLNDNEFEFISDLELNLGCFYAFDTSMKMPEIVTPYYLGWNSLNYPLRMEQGQKFSETWGLDDKIIELSVTPNRGDCLSYLGIIHEIFLGHGQSFSRGDFFAKLTQKFPYQPGSKSFNPRIKIDKNLASSYHLAQVEFAHIGSMPLWLEVFLIKHGLNPKTLPVAATNYIMLLVGQPTHAFDASAIGNSSEFQVQFFNCEKPFKLIDNTEFSSDSPFAFILDGNNEPLALAGVMGGLNCSVIESSTKVIFESASFSDAAIRQSRRSGVVTDSSLRFERGVDSCISKMSLELLLGIVQNISPQSLVSTTTSSYVTTEAKKVPVTLDAHKLTSLLGISIDEQILSRLIDILGGKFENNSLILPYLSHRYDIEQSCDLAEEIMRLYGTLYPSEPLTNNTLVDPKTSSDFPLEFFVQRGFYEVMTFGFMSFDKASSYYSNNDSFIKLSNPISSALSTMAPSLLPNLLDIAAQCRAHRQNKIALVESAWVFSKEFNNNQKTSLAAVILPDLKQRWNGVNNAQHNSIFYDMKQYLNELGVMLGLSFTFKAIVHDFYEDGFNWAIECNSEIIGFMGAVDLRLCQKYQWPEQSWVFEIDRDKLFYQQGQYQDFSRLPKVQRDLSFNLEKDQSVDFLLNFIQNNHDDQNIDSLDADVFDYFEDTSTGRTSVGVRLTFQSFKSTLTDQQLDDYVKKLLEDIKAHCGLTVR